MSNKNYHLHLGVMHCSSTEDFGSDEILIKRYEDGIHHGPDLRWEGALAGNQYRFHGQYGEFDTNFKIEVSEEDPGVDDEIGEITINSANIDTEYVRMDPWGYGDYSLTWTNLTPHINEIKRKHTDMVGNQPNHGTMSAYKGNIDVREGHEAISSHIKDKHEQTHKAIVKTVHTFYSTSDLSKRQAVVDELKEVIDFTPLRGIIKNIHNAMWPTIVLYGMVSPVNFGFADFVQAYGIALQTDGTEAGVILTFGLDIGITVGDEAKIAIGINRNTLENVPGFTYSYTRPAYDQLNGGLRYSYDLTPDVPNLKQVVYSFSEFPAGLSVGYNYTAVVR